MDPLNEDFIDLIITNLKIISKIKVNEKLCIRKGHLQIDRDYKLQSLKRWFYHDSRETALNYIKDLLRNLVYLMNNISRFKKEELLFILTRILNETDSVEIGIKNLKVTYNDDPVTTVTLDNILLKLREITQNTIRPLLI
jgi:uncharacterized protein YjcR